ncbi:MAG: hypothetical protein LBT51_11035 [Fusobacteriaceae bacterium]|jgi:hypothetical protein|nr:hypothetical protein [Fusobacteriaceae bacterium]
MNVDQLYDLIKDYYGYKSQFFSLYSKGKYVKCILYNSFELKCGIEENEKSIKAVIKINDNVEIEGFLDQKFSSNNNESSIKQLLQRDFILLLK